MTVSQDRMHPLALSKMTQTLQHVGGVLSAGLVMELEDDIDSTLWVVEIGDRSSSSVVRLCVSVLGESTSELEELTLLFMQRSDMKAREI